MEFFIEDKLCTFFFSVCNFFKYGFGSGNIFVLSYHIKDNLKINLDHKWWM